MLNCQDFYKSHKKVNTTCQHQVAFQEKSQNLNGKVTKSEALLPLKCLAPCHRSNTVHCLSARAQRRSSIQYEHSSTQILYFLHKNWERFTEIWQKALQRGIVKLWKTKFTFLQADSIHLLKAVLLVEWLQCFLTSARTAQLYHFIKVTFITRADLCPGHCRCPTLSLRHLVRSAPCWCHKRIPWLSSPC